MIQEPRGHQTNQIEDSTRYLLSVNYFLPYDESLSEEVHFLFQVIVVFSTL
nr:hypothetical protein [uncultured bacterium]